jgi:hypothetical protein
MKDPPRVPGPLEGVELDLGGLSCTILSPDLNPASKN